ncbi:MAG: hypothetical protein WBP83_15605, partial [Nitrososphaeraceae archaeon]
TLNQVSVIVFIFLNHLIIMDIFTTFISTSLATSLSTSPFHTMYYAIDTRKGVLTMLKSGWRDL